MVKVARLQTTRAIEQGDLNPVGMIVASMLTEPQFQALNGTSWVLASGQSVAGSTYAAVTGNTAAPDLRGMVLRGKNNGRADGNQDPGGERPVGDFQSHATAKNGLTTTHNITDSGHKHNTGVLASGGPHTYGTIYGISGTGEGNLNGLDSSTQTANITGSVTIGPGDAETRMRNVAVNHFIKIN